MERSLIHYGLHFILPLIIIFIFFKENWVKGYAVMLLGFVIDVDHLIASPIFDLNRCSINFHPLHRYYMMPIYVLLAGFKKTRWLGLGLVSHIIADFADCALIDF